MTAAILLSVLLLQAPAGDLPDATAGHNERAQALYEAGKLDEALVELTAAYDALPDPRADRAGRDLLLGSMRGVLLELHARTGEAAPLCDLRGRLERHLERLGAAGPEDPPPADVAVIQAHLRDVDARLGGLPPGACGAVRAAPAPAPAPPSAPAPAPRPAPPADEIPPRHLRIAGSVILGLGGALAGVMTYGLVDQTRLRRQARDIDQAATGRPLTPDEFETLESLRSAGVMRRNLAIGAGVVGAMAVVFGALLVARAGPRARRVALAPWWSTGGGGLMVQSRTR